MVALSNLFLTFGDNPKHAWSITRQLFRRLSVRLGSSKASMPCFPPWNKLFLTRRTKSKMTSVSVRLLLGMFAFHASPFGNIHCFIGGLSNRWLDALRSFSLTALLNTFLIESAYLSQSGETEFSSPIAKPALFSANSKQEKVKKNSSKSSRFTLSPSIKSLFTSLPRVSINNRQHTYRDC